MDIVFDVDGTLMNIEHRVKYARKYLPDVENKYPITKLRDINPDYDYDKFESEIVRDTPNAEVFQIAIALHEVGHTILIASGRKQKQQKETEMMLCEANTIISRRMYLLGKGNLNRYGAFWRASYFRKDDDNRKDSIIKEEMYEQMLEDGYDPKLVFDDRQQVVDMWRSKGTRVCQVAEGNF